MSILFKRYHVPLILSGAKSQTRRMGRRRWTEGTAQWGKTGFRKDDRFALLWIERVWQERLGDISAADARAEGYPNAHEYLKVFHEINRVPLIAERRVAVENSIVWAVKFEVVKEPAPMPDGLSNAQCKMFTEAGR